NFVRHVLKGNGKDIPGFPQTLPESGPFSKFAINPSFADIDGDGFPEIITAVSDQINSYVVAYNRFGQQVRNSTLSGDPFWAQGAVTVASDDSDGVPV